MDIKRIAARVSGRRASDDVRSYFGELATGRIIDLEPELEKILEETGEPRYYGSWFWPDPAFSWDPETRGGEIFAAGLSLGPGPIYVVWPHEYDDTIYVYTEEQKSGIFEAVRNSGSGFAD